MFIQFAVVLLLISIVDDTHASAAECNFDSATAEKTSEPLHKFFTKLQLDILSRNPDKNVIYSPISIALALAMIEGGASGRTRAELKNVLAPNGFDGDASSLYQALQHQLKIQSPHGTLSVSNGLFYEKAFSLQADYIDNTAKCFETVVEGLDFAHQSEQARQKINTWGSNATAEKIPEVIKPGTLNQDTKAVLASAIYMNASWLIAFDDGVEDRKFYSMASAEKAKMVKFFSRSAQDTKYARNDDYEMVEIPYKDMPISMILIKAKAPNTGVSSAIESKVAATISMSPSQFWANFSFRRVALSIPRFTIRLSTSLNDVLARLGMASVFSNSADFSRMDPSNRIRVSSMVHEAFIKVNENGTEAAAITTGGLDVRSSGWIQFTLDYPFLFNIVHHPTGTILFTGKVNTIEPESQ